MPRHQPRPVLHVRGNREDQKEQAMVAEPARHSRLVEEVAALYDWIGERLRQESGRVGRCNACGACCDFPAYGHRLFVTPPELIYLAARLDVDRLEPMPGGRCP